MDPAEGLAQLVGPGVKGDRCRDDCSKQSKPGTFVGRSHAMSLWEPNGGASEAPRCSDSERCNHAGAVSPASGVRPGAGAGKECCRGGERGATDGRPTG
jgi:hypothetical protein